MKCASCKWNYPENILAPIYVKGSYSEPVCGICALQIRNEALNIDKLTFEGLQAEVNRLTAIKWRETHPADAPGVL